jgi:hypothetical protein
MPRDNLAASSNRCFAARESILRAANPPIFPFAQSLATAHSQHMGTPGSCELLSIGCIVLGSTCHALSGQEIDEHRATRRHHVFPWTADFEGRNTVAGHSTF